MKQLLIGLLAVGTLACNPVQKGTERVSVKPHNIILLIGDGMGTTAVSTGFYYGEGPSQFNRFRNIGLSETSSAKQKVTDSAASGTAMATGVSTYNKAIGVDTLKNPVANITELVSRNGWSTGVVATSSVTHATPASFYGHIEDRYMEEEIALQLLDSEIDFFAGGGMKFFTGRKDGRDLFQEAGKKGFILDSSNLSLPGSLSSNSKYGFILAPELMPYMEEGRGDFLPSAAALAIGHLSGDPDGFFLMVEGSLIDKAAHKKNASSLIAEMLDFEQAIAVAMDFAEKDENTLVVVTADHETGGFALSEKLNEATGKKDRRFIGPNFATGGHTATMVPVFAYGPGAEEFMGIYKNTGIFNKMKELVLAD